MLMLRVYIVSGNISLLIIKIYFMQQDPWISAQKNFRILGIIASLFTAMYIIAFLQTGVVFYMGVIAITLISAVILLITAKLFKNRSPKAITIGYLYIAFTVALFLVNNIILNPISELSQGILMKLIPLIIPVLLFLSVRKVSRQPSVTI